MADFDAFTRSCQASLATAHNETQKTTATVRSWLVRLRDANGIDITRVSGQLRSLQSQCANLTARVNDLEAGSRQVEQDLRLLRSQWMAQADFPRSAFVQVLELFFVGDPHRNQRKLHLLLASIAVMLLAIGVIVGRLLPAL